MWYSVYIAQFPEYTVPLIDHLMEFKIGHWDMWDHYFTCYYAVVVVVAAAAAAAAAANLT